VGWILLLAGQAAHVAEAGQDERRQGGLGTAGENRVGRAATNDLGALTERVGTGCAGGDHGEVDSAETKADRQLAAGRVGENAGNEPRCHATGTAFEQRLLLLRDAADVADGRAEDNPDPLVRVGADEIRVFHGLLGGGQ